MLYHVFELQRATLAPMRLMASHALSILDMPFNPWRPTAAGRLTAAALDSFEHSTRRFGKPEFGLKHTTIDGETVDIVEDIVHSDTWCDLKRFRRVADRPDDPKVLMVAPMSGHYATLLRGTVKAFLPDHDVYITDWRDAREVPLTAPDFDLSDYIDNVIGHLRLLGPDTHVIAVCQPAVPVLAAVALMNEAGDPDSPHSMTLIGGPIDTREGVDHGERFRQAAQHRLVPPQRHPPRAVRPSRVHAAGLSGLPATGRVHGDEPRPPRGSALADVPASGGRRRRNAGVQAALLRGIPRGDGPARPISTWRPSSRCSRSICCRAAC